MYPRNSVSPERIGIGQVIQISDGAVQSAGVSVVVKPQGGSESAGSGTIAYSAATNSVEYTPTQAETDHTSFIVRAYKTGCFSAERTIITSAASTAGQVVTDSASRTASQATGFSTHSAADVWTNGTRTVSSAANITSDSGVINSSSGIVEGNVKQINDDSNAALRLALSAAQILPGTVDSTAVSPTTTSFESDDITETTTNHYNGRIIIFTSGDLLGQATDITSYTINGGRGVFTVTALTEAPADNDTFIVV